MSKHWSDVYPHDLYCSVLLLDGVIVDYKIGNRCWETKEYITLRGQITYDEYLRSETKYTIWTVNNDDEHDKVFNKLSLEWMDQFETRVNYRSDFV